MYYIYIFQNKINNKIYIGQTKNFKHRCYEHIGTARGNTSPLVSRRYYLHKAINKYGLDNFQYFIIEEWESEDDIMDAEQFWISFFQSNKRGFGYNLTIGGEKCNGWKGKKHSLETRKKMSKIRKEYRLNNKEHYSNIMSGEKNPNCKISDSIVINILLSWNSVSNKNKYGFKKLFWKNNLANTCSYKYFIAILTGKIRKKLSN